VRKTTHKYGIEVPTSVEHAYRIDTANGNTFWRDAIKLEMVNVGIAFEVLEEGVSAPPGWHKVTGHLIFDVKKDFTRKARWVLDGHKTTDPVYISTYAGVVSRESVRIAFTYAALNGLGVSEADIRRICRHQAHRKTTTSFAVWKNSVSKESCVDPPCFVRRTICRP
jgi:hypothetical protein